MPEVVERKLLLFLGVHREHRGPRHERGSAHESVAMTAASLLELCAAALLIAAELPRAGQPLQRP